MATDRQGGEGSRRTPIPENRRAALRAELFGHYRADPGYEGIVNDLRERHRDVIASMARNLFMYEQVEAACEPRPAQPEPIAPFLTPDQLAEREQRREALRAYRDDLARTVGEVFRLNWEKRPARWALQFLHADILPPLEGAELFADGERIGRIRELPEPQEVRLILRLDLDRATISVEPDEYAAPGVIPRHAGEGGEIVAFAREMGGAQPFLFDEWKGFEDRALAALSAAIGEMRRRQRADTALAGENAAMRVQRAEYMADLFRWLFHGKKIPYDHPDGYENVRERIRENIANVIRLDLPRRGRAR